MHKTLHGITWDHTRGYTSIEAVSQRYHELHSDVEIRWQVRSLQTFADEPINELAERFDLLIIDHPWAGYAAYTGVILPLDTLLPEDFMADQASHSVGHSHISYQYRDHQWALAIDAATPVAASRPDLLYRHEVSLPKNWESLVALATQGHVAIPGIAQDILMSFYMICSTLGEHVCTTPDVVISEDVGLQALDMLRDLGQYIDTLSPDGKDFEQGYWYNPTVLGGIKADHATLREELFGPVLPIMEVDGFEEAVALSNVREEGLSAYLYTNNYKKQMKAIDLLEVGTIFINKHIVGYIQGYHSGHKTSGIGGEDGIFGIEGYLQKRTIYMDYN